MAKNKSILDIGCGRGGGLNYINKNFAPLTCYGVDFSKRNIEFCLDEYKDTSI